MVRYTCYHPLDVRLQHIYQTMNKCHDNLWREMKLKPNRFWGGEEALWLWHRWALCHRFWRRLWSRRADGGRCGWSRRRGTPAALALASAPPQILEMVGGKGVDLHFCFIDSWMLLLHILILYVLKYLAGYCYSVHMSKTNSDFSVHEKWAAWIG